MAMNDAGNHVEPVPVNNPLQQVVDRQDEQIKQLKETNKDMKEQLKQKEIEVISVHSYDVTQYILSLCSWRNCVKRLA